VYTSQWAKSPKKQKKNSLKECVFINSALKIQCRVAKNTLLQTAFCISTSYDVQIKHPFNLVVM